MVEMTLNMMVAMGVLEQIPGRLVYDGNPYNRLVRAKYGRSRSQYDYPRGTDYFDGPSYDLYDLYDGYDSLDSLYDYRDWGGGPYRSYSRSPYRYGSRYRGWDSPWSYDPWETVLGDPWSGAYYNQLYSPQLYSPQLYSPQLYSPQLYSPWSSMWGNRLNNPWGNSWNNPWGNPLNSPWSGSWNNPWVNPWSGTMTGPFVNPNSGGGAWSGVPGYSSMPMPPAQTPGNSSSGSYGGNGVAVPYSHESMTGNVPATPDSSRVNSYNFNNISAFPYSDRPGSSRMPGYYRTGCMIEDCERAEDSMACG